MGRFIGQDDLYDDHLAGTPGPVFIYDPDGTLREVIPFREFHDRYPVQEPEPDERRPLKAVGDFEGSVERYLDALAVHHALEAAVGIDAFYPQPPIDPPLIDRIPGEPEREVDLET